MQAQLAAWFDGALWFWIAAAAVWWRVCAATLGVPNDLMLRALRDSEDAALFERLARRNVATAAAGARRGGVAAAALAGFMLTFLAAYAWLARSGAAAGGFVILGPLTLHAVWTARAALALDGAQPDADALLRRFRALRTQAFAAALTSLGLAAVIRAAARASALG